jgi:uncharacterized cupredoxin-like copper-binding protein
MILNKLKLRLTAVLVVALFLTTTLWSSSVFAATLQFTDAVKASLTKTAQAAGGAKQTKLMKQYDDLASLQKQSADWDSKTSTLHYSNETILSSLRKKIKDIDADKIIKLEDQVKQTKAKYQPLFTTYSSLTKQATAAKSLKDKTLYKALRGQADVLKITVDLARQDIRAKETSLKTAKTDKSRKATQVRSILSEIDPLKTKIKSERSLQSTPNKSITTEWTNFKGAAKKGDADRSSDSLARLLTLSGQVSTYKQNIYNLEVKISAVLGRAKLQLP